MITRYLTVPRILAILAMLAILVLSLLPGHASAADATTASVLAPARVEAGEQFTVNIYIEPGTEIAGIQFDLTFDASMVSVDSVVEGGLLSQNGASTYFNQGTIDNVAGTVDGVFGAITTPGQSVSTDGIFAVITFTAGDEGGSCPVDISNLLIGDIDGHAVDVTIINDTVPINHCPVLGAVGTRSVNEGEALEFTVTATDGDDDSLTLSASNLPSGATFDAETGVFSWTPRFDQAGTYDAVRFEVTDSASTDFEEITITVVQEYQDWDVNEDSGSNVLDMVLIGQHFGETGQTGWIRADCNEDGTINVLDMIIVGQHWTG